MITVNEMIDNNWKEIEMFVGSNPSQHDASFWVGTVAPIESSLGHPLKPGGTLSRERFGENDKFWFKSNFEITLTITR